MELGKLDEAKTDLRKSLPIMLSNADTRKKLTELEGKKVKN